MAGYLLPGFPLRLALCWSVVQSKLKGSLSDMGLCEAFLDGARQVMPDQGRQTDTSAIREQAI